MSVRRVITRWQKVSIWWVQNGWIFEVTCQIGIGVALVYALRYWLYNYGPAWAQYLLGLVIAAGFIAGRVIAKKRR